MQDRRAIARKMQTAGKGVSGLGQVVEVATDLLDQPRLLDAMSEDTPGPAGFGILSRIRSRLRRKP